MNARSLFVSLLALFLCVACISPEEAREAGLGVAAEPPLELEEAVRRSVPPELVPAFEAVVQALEDRDQVVARGALSRVFAARPEGRSLELALAFERIIDGRELAAGIRMALVGEERSSLPLRFGVSLAVSHEGAEAVTLRASGARLHELLVVVDPDGRDARDLLQWPAVVDSAAHDRRPLLGAAELPAARSAT